MIRQNHPSPAGKKKGLIFKLLEKKEEMFEYILASLNKNKIHFINEWELSHYENYRNCKNFILVRMGALAVTEHLDKARVGVGTQDLWARDL